METHDTASGTLAEHWESEHLELDRVFAAVAAIGAGVAPSSEAARELPLLQRALAKGRDFSELELLLVEAEGRVRNLLGMSPDDDNFDDDGSLESGVAAVFFCLFRWCLECDRLDAEAAVDWTETLLVRSGLPRSQALRILNEIICAGDL